MKDLSLEDRLQPSLLDRLTDDAPMTRVESREDRVISIPELRRGLLRDLAWLLNAVHLEATLDLEEYPHVRKSVLNYGLPGFAGSWAATVSEADLDAALRGAILTFEPRLTPDSIKIDFIADDSGETEHTIALAIDAELWAQPVPIQIFLKTELDLELGAMRVSEIPEQERTRLRRRRGR